MGGPRSSSAAAVASPTMPPPTTMTSASRCMLPDSACPNIPDRITGIFRGGRGTVSRVSSRPGNRRPEIRMRGAASVSVGRTPHEVRDELCRSRRISAR